MALLWFFLGALLVVTIVGLRSWINANNVSLTVAAWLGLIVGALLFFFTIAWCVTSIVEGETQAAMMGMLFFGVPAIIVLVLTGRSMVKRVA